MKLEGITPKGVLTFKLTREVPYCSVVDKEVTSDPSYYYYRLCDRRMELSHLAPNDPYPDNYLTHDEQGYIYPHSFYQATFKCPVHLNESVTITVKELTYVERSKRMP